MEYKLKYSKWFFYCKFCNTALLFPGLCYPHHRRRPPSAAASAPASTPAQWPIVVFFMYLFLSCCSARRFHLPHLCFDPLQGEFKPHGQRREQLVHHLLGPLADIQPGHKGQRSGYVFWRRDWRWLWPCCLILSTYLGTYANDTIIELRKQYGKAAETAA